MDWKEKNILIVAGGTGGHIFPALNLSEFFIKKGLKVTYVTDNRFKDWYKEKYKRLFTQNKNRFNLQNIPIVRLTKFNFIKFCALFLISVFLCLKKIKTNKSEAIILFGGYVCLPAFVAAILSNKKIFLHEQNAILGVSNKIMLPFASALFTSFEDTKDIPQKYQNRTYFYGLPLSDSFITEASTREFSRNDPLKEKATIKVLIFGGSQGSSLLSENFANMILEVTKSIKSKKFIITHQVRGDVKQVESLYKQNSVECFVKSFFTNSEELMFSSDILIARSGANTVIESYIAGVSSILIPIYSSKKNHQLENAIALNGSYLLEEPNLNKERLTSIILQIINEANYHSIPWITRYENDKMINKTLASSELMFNHILRFLTKKNG